MKIFVVQSENQDLEYSRDNLRGFRDKEKAEAFVKLLPEVIARNLVIRQRAFAEAKEKYPEMARQHILHQEQVYWDIVRRIHKETPPPAHLGAAAEHYYLKDSNEFYLEEMELEE